MSRSPLPLPAALWLLAILAAAAPSARAGIIYVSEDSSDQIVTYNTAGGSPTTFDTSGLSSPEGLAFDSSGNLYVANSPGGSTGTIEKITPGGTASVFFSGTAVGDAVGLAFDSSGNLYVDNGGSNTIAKITPGGTASQFYGGTGVTGPEGLAFDSSGNLYIANVFTSTIEKITSGGTASLFYTGTGLAEPIGLAFDSSGNLYVDNHLNSTIEKITSGGTASVFYTGAGVSVPEGLAFDSSGNLYVANTGNNTDREDYPGWLGEPLRDDGRATELLRLPAGVGSRAPGAGAGRADGLARAGLRSAAPADRRDPRDVPPGSDRAHGLSRPDLDARSTIIPANHQNDEPEGQRTQHEDPGQRARDHRQHPALILIGPVGGQPDEGAERSKWDENSQGEHVHEDQPLDPLLILRLGQIAIQGEPDGDENDQDHLGAKRAPGRLPHCHGISLRAARRGSRRRGRASR